MRKSALQCAAAFAAALAIPASAQTTGSILDVELVNSTAYFFGSCALADQGKNPNKLTRPSPNPALVTGVGLADIVSVNGTPVKGLAMETFLGALVSTTMTSGRAIADFTGAPTSAGWELVFLSPDGTLIGTLEFRGSSMSGQHPLGAPSALQANNTYTVIGGTGPFLGVRGYFSPVQDSVSPERQTTDCEDPAYRRINADPGGNKRHGALYLISPNPPAVVSRAGSPAIFHSDLTAVNAQKPAAPGELLVAMVTGLGVTVPAVEPGQPFPPAQEGASQAVAAPVGVIVNQQDAGVISAAGWPELVDTYRVDFRLPAEVTSGSASVAVSVAWMYGRSVSIPVQGPGN
jgi:hypothetical protein